MRTPRRASALLVLAFVLATGVAPAGGPRPAAAATVTGIVSTALRPLAGVHVELPALGAWARTDTTGRFVLRGVPAGVHRLELAAVGYGLVHASVVVDAAADSATVVDAGPFLVAPLRPDEKPIGFRAPPPQAPGAARTPAPAPAPTPAPPGAARPSTPPPAERLAPPVGFFRTGEEMERWPNHADLKPASAAPQSTAEAFADLLRRVAVADSITAATGGTGAPGHETWRQWGDRFQLFASDSARALEPRLRTDSALVVRAVAYARTRAALAAGPTIAGYRMATEARAALARASRAGGEDAAFLRSLSGEVDRVFVPGSTPPQPPRPTRRKRAPARRRR